MNPASGRSGGLGSRLVALLDRPVALLLCLGGLILVFLAAVHVHLAPDVPSTTPGLRSTPVEPVKVLVYFVDGLRPDNVDPAVLPTIAGLRARGLYAEVEPCYDRLTVPCLHEAFTGTVNTGLLGAWSNLVSNEVTGDSNLFSDVVASGRTVAVIHHNEFAAFAPWLTAEHRGKKGREALAEFLARGIDLIVYHHVSFDNTFHKHRVGSKRYKAALEKLETESAEIFASLPPEYRVVVMGDHGHTDGGRHILGLDVPTVMISPPGLLDTAPVSGRLPITTLRYVIGAWLGILPPPQYEGADLADRLPAGSALRADAERQTYGGAPRHPTGFPAWGIAVVVALGGLASALLPRPVRRWAALGLAAAAASGALYMVWIPDVHATRIAAKLEEWLISGLVGLALGGALLRRGRASAAAALLLPWLVLPGSLYEYGLFQNLPALLCLGAIFVCGPAFASRAALPAGATLGAAVVGGAVLLADMKPFNFSILRYGTLQDVPLAVTALGWAAVAWLWDEGPPRRRLGLALAAGLGASGLVPVEGYPLAALTVAVAAAALRWPAALPVLASFAAVPWWGASGAAGVAVAVGMTMALVRLSAREPEGAWFLPAAALCMAYLTMGLTTGLRTNGLDFGFAVQWFPDGWHEKLWWLVGAAMTVKALTPAVMVVRLARRAIGARAVWRGAAAAGALRLAAGAAFLLGMLALSGEIARGRLIELVEDELAWWLVLAVVTLVPWPRAAEPVSTNT